jgi:hypothetical protein
MAVVPGDPDSAFGFGVIYFRGKASNHGLGAERTRNNLIRKRLQKERRSNPQL